MDDKNLNRIEKVNKSDNLKNLLSFNKNVQTLTKNKASRKL